MSKFEEFKVKQLAIRSERENNFLESQNQDRERLKNQLEKERQRRRGLQIHLGKVANRFSDQFDKDLIRAAINSIEKNYLFLCWSLG